MILASSMLNCFLGRESRNKKMTLWTDSLVVLKIYLRLAGKCNSEKLMESQKSDLMSFVKEMYKKCSTLMPTTINYTVL